MANFFDQFDGEKTSDGRPSITVNPIRPGYDKAIAAIESGGNYGVVGPPTRDGDRAFGKYQVMGKNVGPWTKEALGQEMSPQQFMANPKAQDAVFQHKFGGYVDKYGPEGAAKAWFAGEGGMNDPNRRDVLGTSVADYGRKFMSAMGPKSAETAPQPKGNFFDQFDGAAQPAPQPRPFDTRFEGEPSQAQPNPALAPALQKTATEMTRAAPTSPAANMAIDAGNQLAAASQGTTPHIDAYQGRLLSTETFQDDAGNILFRDPQTGNVRPTDKSKHVALRDPNDNTIKIYSRDAATNEGPAVGLSRVLAPGLTAGAPTARAALGASNKVIPKASDIFSTAKPIYREFTKEAGGIEVPVETAAGMADRFRRALDKVNLDVDMAGKPAAAAIRMLESGEPLTLDYLQRIKRIAGRGFNNTEKDVRDGAAAISSEIGKIISEVAPEAAKNLKKADAIHSTAIAVQDLQRKGAVADLRAGRAGYGGNAVNTMRQVLSPIVQRAVEGKMTGFKPDEITAMREIVEGTSVTNALRLVGQVSPTSGLGTLRAAGAGGTAMMAGASGAVAALIPAIGMASNKLATIITGKQLDHLTEIVTKRSPAYAQAVAKSVERYERAQMELVNKPSPAKFAAYVSASRALSAGLTKDGIEVTSGALLKQIAGQPPAQAEPE